MSEIKLWDCGHEAVGAGYDECGRSLCYGCCAEMDRETLRQGKPIVLYLSGMFTVGTYQPAQSVSNWPGSLKIVPARVSKSKHIVCGRYSTTRYDVWFRAEGRNWHGVNIGDGQILRCKAVKGRR